jgi:hypothetical protein
MAKLIFFANRLLKPPNRFSSFQTFPVLKVSLHIRQKQSDFAVARDFDFEFWPEETLGS